MNTERIPASVGPLLTAARWLLPVVGATVVAVGTWWDVKGRVDANTLAIETQATAIEAQGIATAAAIAEIKGETADGENTLRAIEIKQAVNNERLKTIDERTQKIEQAVQRLVENGR